MVSGGPGGRSRGAVPGQLRRGRLGRVTARLHGNPSSISISFDVKPMAYPRVCLESQPCARGDRDSCLLVVVFGRWCWDAGGVAGVLPWTTSSSSVKPSEVM